MKNIISYIFAFLSFIAAISKAQVYTHPIVGINNENVGACLVNTCGGTYYDNGGIGGSCTTSGVAGNYSNSINGVYRVFCPNTAGQCLRATFTQFCIEGGAGCPFEYFEVRNGSTQNSPALFLGCGAGAIGPFTGTANGCLSFRFWSDGSVNRAGWAANFSCVPCAGAPTGTTNADCNFLTPVCTSVAINSNAVGPGIISDGCTPGSCPAGGENYSNWYQVTFATSGTFNFQITPNNVADDYDFAVYGPNLTCATLGVPIRCNDCYLGGPTGLSAAGINPTEMATTGCNLFCTPMNVIAGDTYFIVVDSWSPPTTGYTLNWGGTASLNCAILPVELVSFTSTYNMEQRSVNLNWSTASERNSDYFAVERSVDGIVFEEMDKVKAARTSSKLKDYKYTDKNPFPGEINYYRLRQVDLTGEFKYSNIEAVAINDPKGQFNIYPNPTNGNAEILYHTAYESDYHIKIYDYTAKLVLSHHFKSVPGKNIIPLDLNGFSKGVYFVTLQGNGDMIKTSFIRE